MSPVIYKSVGALGLGRFSDRTQHSESDRMRRACVRSQVTYADIGRETWSAEAKAGPDTGLSQVMVDLTRPVDILPLGELSGNDLTLGGRANRRVRSSVGGTRRCEHLTRG